MTDGYFGVIIRSKLFWQGYFLPESLRPAGQDIVRKMRAALEANEEIKLGELVLKPAPDVKLPDQRLFGMICGTLAAVSQEKPELVGTLAAGLRYLTGHDFFLVRAHEGADGYLTNYEQLHVTSQDAAREAINADPDVQAMKAEILQALRR